MNDYATSFDADQASIIIDRLIAKGGDLLELCLEQGKSLCMKGFIDCQIEKGGPYLRVVEGLVAHLELRLSIARRGPELALLRDLLGYAEGQLQEANVLVAEPLDAI